MPTLTFTFPVGCFICGYRNLGSEVAFDARVNKHSIRTGQTLAAVPRNCRECGWPTPDFHYTRLRLDEESAQKVAAARRKKGWPT
jgi:hypothetical protein